MRISLSSMTALLILASSAMPLTGQSTPAKKGEIKRERSGPIRVNGIAAKANGDVITMNELRIKVAPQQSVLMARFPRRGAAYQEQLRQLENLYLDELIDRTIIFTEFKDRVKAFPDHEVEAEVRRIIQNVYNGDEKLFRKYLKATNLTRAEFKKQQRKELLVQIVRSQHFGDIPPPTDAEMRKEYKKWAIQNRDRTKDVGTYRKIFIPRIDRNDITSTPEGQLQLAEKLSAELKAGGDFATAARTYSRDSKAENGGLWEDVPREDLNAEFGYILFESEGNEIMGPIEGPRGFNIVQVTKRKYGPSEPFSKVRDKMKRRVEADKKKANFEVWMKKMRKRAVIEKMIEPAKR